MGAKSEILEFLRIVRITSDFGVLKIITDIFKTTQKLRFWSFCGGRKTSDFRVFAYIVRSRDAKFPGILRVVNFHREYWEFCGNIGNFGEYSETLGILK